MSLAYQIFASWRDPAVKAQRKWVFSQMNNQLSSSPWLYYFVLILLGLFILTEMNATPESGHFKYVLIGTYCYVVAMGFSVFAILPQIRVFRAKLAQVAMAQAAILWLGCWLILAGITGVIVSNWIPFWLFLNSGLMGLMMAMYFPQLFMKGTSKQNDSASAYVMFFSMIVAALFGFYGFTVWAFGLPLIFSICIFAKAKSWLKPRTAFSAKQFTLEERQNQMPVMAKWHVELQQFLRTRLDLRSVLIGLGVVIAVLVVFSLYKRWSGDDVGSIASSMFSSLLFSAMFSGGVLFAQERKTWPSLWLRQLHSREALWQFSERHFWLMQSIICIALAAATLFTGPVSVQSLVFAVLLSMASLSLLRYALIAVPWFGWGEFKTGRSDSIASIFLLFLLWMVSSTVLKSENLIVIACVAVALIFASVIARRAARQKILQIDLGALRRNQILN
jgi:hypothetical protein